MKKFFTKSVYRYLLPILLLVPVLTKAANYGLDKAAQGTGLGQSDVEVVAANIVQVILGFVGIIFMVLIIYGGFQWMIGARDGEKQTINKAKQTLTTATVGLIIIITAYSVTYYITSYVINASTEAAPAAAGPAAAS